MEGEKALCGGLQYLELTFTFPAALIRFAFVFDELSSLGVG